MSTLRYFWTDIMEMFLRHFWCYQMQHSHGIKHANYRNECGKREPVAIGGYEQKKMERLAIVRKYVESERINETKLRDFEDRISRNLSKNSTGGFGGIRQATKHSNLKLTQGYLSKLKHFESYTKPQKSMIDEIPEYILPYSNRLLKSAYNATMAGVEACGPGVP